VPIPRVEVPIFPGKNITVIGEVVALNYLVKVYGGYSPAERLNRHLRIAEAKRQVGQAVERHARFDATVSQSAPVAIYETLLARGVEPELHRKPREVPRSVLRAGEEMIVMVLQRVSLKESSGGFEPLVGEHAGIEGHSGAVCPSMLARQPGK
jgi:hypothetical protein